MTMILRFGVALLLMIALAAVSSARAQDTSWADEHKRPRADAPPPVADNPAWEKYDFELNYADGTGKVRFKDLAASGQPFVLVWWLTDCPICHMQMPYIQKLQSMVDKGDVD